MSGRPHDRAPTPEETFMFRAGLVAGWVTAALAVAAYIVFA